MLIEIETSTGHCFFGIATIIFSIGNLCQDAATSLRLDE